MTIRSERDQIIYSFICEHWLDNGHSPSHKEIATACGIDDLRYVQESLYRLQSNGLVSLDSGKTRNIRVCDSEFNFIAVRAEHPDPELILLEEIARGLHRLKRERVGES